jgi:hypothetical protein
VRRHREEDAVFLGDVAAQQLDELAYVGELPSAVAGAQRRHEAGQELTKASVLGVHHREWSLRQARMPRQERKERLLLERNVAGDLVFQIGGERCHVRGIAVRCLDLDSGQVRQHVLVLGTEKIDRYGHTVSAPSSSLHLDRKRWHRARPNGAPLDADTQTVASIIGMAVAMRYDTRHRNGQH